MSGGCADKQEGAESEPDVNSGSVGVGGDEDKQASSKREKNEEGKDSLGPTSFADHPDPRDGILSSSTPAAAAAGGSDSGGFHELNALAIFPVLFEGAAAAHWRPWRFFRAFVSLERFEQKWPGIAWRRPRPMDRG
jgi:hypothetical protein